MNGDMDQFFNDLRSGMFQGKAKTNLLIGIYGLCRHMEGYFSFNGKPETEYSTDIRASEPMVSAQLRYHGFVNFLAFLKRQYMPDSFYQLPGLYRIQNYDGPAPKVGAIVDCNPKQSTTYWTTNSTPRIRNRTSLGDKTLVLSNPSAGDCLYSPEVGKALVAWVAKYKRKLYDSELEDAFEYLVTVLKEVTGEKEFILYHGKDRDPFKAKVHSLS